MPVTRSSASDRTSRDQLFPPAAPSRATEMLFLALGSLAILAGLFLTYRAKAVEYIDAPAPLVLSENLQREQLLPILSVFPAGERQRAAKLILDFLQERSGRLPNVGALSRVTVPVRGASPEPRLFTAEQLAAVKPRLSVRTASQFRRQLAMWAALWMAAIWAVHAWWVIRRYGGSQAILPAIAMLTGIGLILMLALRDPLRDTLLFASFGRSVVLGCAVLALVSALDPSSLFRRLSYLPLIAAILLSVILILFGSGPGLSDAKVNLLGFQPAELIKLLLALFLAGYFANRWEMLRSLREQRKIPHIPASMNVPRLEYFVPVAGGVVLALLFFFLQKDMGPALILVCLFLTLYTIARERHILATVGLALMFCGFAAGYILGFPRTVRDRVSMWISPWDNAVRGGDQVVHSLWAMASGGAWGAGLGLGDPELMPAAHTDLILGALGEEWGFLGVVIAALLYLVLIASGIKIAASARDSWSYFAAMGFTLLIAFELILIAGGVLGLLPLSGVVTPFLSYGGTAMIANFAACGVLFAISRRGGETKSAAPFQRGSKRVALALALAGGAILSKAAYIQVIGADATVGAGTLTPQGDGFRRYQYNPRLTAIAQSIPRGSILDPNGLLLASSDAQALEAQRTQFQRMGIVLPPAGKLEARYYPLGAATVHLLGDLRTRANWGARNSSLEERDSAVRLQGYDDHARVVEVIQSASGKPYPAVRYDYRELVPLLRHRHEPEHAAVRRVRERRRDLRMTIDGRLQWRTAVLLRDHLRRIGRQRGAVVVMNAKSGDLLASVSYPLPAVMPAAVAATDFEETMLDRARYGLYPPGSTFKVVTAIAALRKDPALASSRFECKRLSDGRVGNSVRGWGRPIRDDIADKSPHGVLAMHSALVVSCNAYFAQLAAYETGAAKLIETASAFGIQVARPNTPAQLKDALPQAGYGQGQVVASPMQMARVAAAIATGGRMPQGRWILDETNARTVEPQVILPPAEAALLKRAMREVVTNGTGRQAASPEAIAGKTGTAEIENKPSHAWFIGFAPADSENPIAFAVLIENGQYGGSAAAPLAAQVAAAAGGLGLTGVSNEAAR